MISVMFDNNVYQQIVMPEIYTCNQTYYKYQKQCEYIHQLLKENLIKGYLSEIIFQMDSLGLDSKLSMLEGLHKPKKTIDIQQENNYVPMSITIEPSNNPVKPNFKYEDYLTSAGNLGFKIIRNNRIGIASCVPDHMFLKVKDKIEFDKKHEKYCKLLEILSPDGIDKIYELGESKNFVQVLKNINAKKDEIGIKNIKKIFSEWADRDAICCCYGYDIDYFCTEDKGKNAGKGSILHEDNRKWLEDNYKIKVVDLQELLNLI